MTQTLPTNGYFFFGSQPRTLFGSYYPPYQDRGFSHGVLLCYPFGYEYIRAHRVFRQLAIKLSNSGFHVLRFDYYGTGDSSGEMEQASLQHWVEDIAIAEKKLEQCGKIHRICTVGLRLGATMAVLAGNRSNNIDAHVLWEPVISGREYLNELFSTQKKKEKLKSKNEGNLDPKEKFKPPSEIMGFCMSPVIVSELDKTDLMTVPIGALNVKLITSEISSEIERFLQNIQNGNNIITKEIIDDPKLWLEEPYKSIIPVRTLDSIVNWILNLER